MKHTKHLAALLTVALMIFGTAAAASADTYVTMNGFTFYTNAQKGAVIVGYDDHDPCVQIPDSLMGSKVTEIANNAFFEDAAIREISFEKTDGLRRIGNNAFCGCTGVTSVNLPSLEELGFGAFQDCTQLAEVTIDEGLTVLPAQAFYRCESLQDVTLPASVTAIGSYAFGGCTALTSLTVPDSVNQIADNAFDGCGALVICCGANSYAHHYAAENGISVVCPDSCLLGDADGDGTVSILDATNIQRHLAHYTVSDPENTVRCGDIDGNGLDIMDATRIQRFLAFYEVPYPIGELVDVSATAE